MPQDLKFDLGPLAQDEAVAAGRYLVAVIRGRLTESRWVEIGRIGWQTLRKHHSKKLDA
jgi:hypothetical protein